jgi:hypothetical protein
MDRDVVHDPDAMTETLGATPLERLPDRGEPEALAGVDREVEVLPGDVVEGIEVAAGWEAGLRAGDVEPDDPGVAPADGELRDLERPGGRARIPP